MRAQGRESAGSQKNIPSQALGAYSLSYEHRLHYAWQFRKFFEGSEVLKLRECRIFRIPNDQHHFRLGITLKARGSSVDRNRVKRTIRESLRGLAPTLGPYDYNVVIRSGTSLDYRFAARLRLCLHSELTEELRRVAQKRL